MTHRYDCHMSAGYMAKYFGVTFRGDNLTVHPDSLHIFDPHPGDLCLIAGGNEAHQINRTTRLPVGQKIIMRNGRPFISPRTENAADGQTAQRTGSGNASKAESPDTSQLASER